MEVTWNKHGKNAEHAKNESGTIMKERGPNMERTWNKHEMNVKQTQNECGKKNMEKTWNEQWNEYGTITWNERGTNME